MKLKYMHMLGGAYIGLFIAGASGSNDEGLLKGFLLVTGLYLTYLGFINKT